MPIYAYRCSACGHAKDVLQKMSDPLLHTCPACSAETFTKQLTAAGFQLKGTGWYATDFKGGPAPVTGDAAAKAGEKAKPVDAAASTAAPAAGAAAATAAAPAPAAAPKADNAGSRNGGSGAAAPASHGGASAGH